MALKILGNKLIGNQLAKALIFVVSAPAGTGKTTLVQRLIREFPCVVSSISYTTRPPRKCEVPGKDYHFFSEKEFERMIERGEFLEYVRLYGYYYGTSYRNILELQQEGKHVILTIDTQGALKLKNQLEAIFIFIHPPSLHALKERLKFRQTDSMEAIDKRIEWAESEIAQASFYDYNIVNDNLENAYQILRSILIAEEHRIRKN